VLPVRYELNLYMLCRRKQTASVVWWSEFLTTYLEVRVRFPALPGFLSSGGSGTGSTLRSYLKKKYRLRSRNPKIGP
jgi:hypothetical protein